MNPATIYARECNYVFVVTDAGNAIYEITKTNNVLVAPQPLVIVPAYPADLAVVQVHAPGTLVAGTPATITWAVTNLGAGTTSVSNWIDSVWLSPAQTLNPKTEILLADVPHNDFLAPGDMYNQSQILNLPNCDNGSYYVIVITDSGQAVNGDATTFNHQLATAGPSVVWPDPAARLEVSALTPPASAQAGYPLTVAWTVQNLGNAATNASWYDAVYLSSTAQFVQNSSTLLGFYLHTNSQGSGGSYQQSQSPEIPACISGSYYVAVMTDAGGVVNAATCSTNNVLTSAAPVKILSGSYASLQVLGLNVPASVNSGTAWTVQWSVTNAGPSAATNPWSDAVYASLQPTLDTNALLLARFVYTNDLAAGGSYAQTQSVFLPSCLSGDYNIFVVADVSNAVNVTSCLVNNQAISTNPVVVNYGLYPDLLITAIGNPPSATPGQSMTVSWSVTNNGLATAPGPWTDSVYLAASGKFSPANSVLLGNYTQTGAIAAGAGYTQSTSFTLPNASGTFYVVVVVDSGGAVQQCQAAGNNVTYSPTSVNLPATLYPGLKVTSVQVPTTAYAGQNINVMWVVTNEGTETTPTANWSDTLYLALGQELESGTLTLHSYPSPMALAVGQSYTNTATVAIPAGLSGPYYILALADSGGRLLEHLGYNDSLGFNASPMVVALPPPADLVATSATLSPNSGAPGTAVTITWNVSNPSTNAIPATWTDAVYLSTNTVWDLTALPVATVNRTGLAGESNYTGSWTGPLPALTPGTYYAIVRADVRATVNEITLTNNSATSTSTINVDVPVLTLGQAATNTLTTGAARYYKLSAPALNTVRITLMGSASNAGNEVFVRFGAVPDLGNYDFLYSNPLSPNQEIVIPTTQTGWYYLMVRGGSEPNGPLAYTLEADIVPMGISNVSATHIGDNGQVTLTLTGAKFEPGAVFQLVSGTNLYTPKTNLFGNGTSLTVRYFFTNAVNGLYDAVLTNPDGTATTNHQSITIEPAIPLTAEVIPALVNSSPRVGLPFEWNGSVLNAGNVDIQYLTVVVSDDSGSPIVLTPPLQAIEADAKSTDNALNACIFYVRDLAVGTSDNFSFSISDFGDNGFYYYIIPTAQSKQEFLEYIVNVGEQLRETWLDIPTGLEYTTTNTDGLIATNLLNLPADLTAAMGDTNMFAVYFAGTFVAGGFVDPEDLSDLPLPSNLLIAALPNSTLLRFLLQFRQDRI